MFPHMMFCIISTDPDFVIDMSNLLHSRQAEVYIARSFDEYDQLQQRGAIFEMLVVDPVFRMG